MTQINEVPSAQPEPHYDEFRDVELLSELRARFSCFDEEEESYYRALSNAIVALKLKPGRKKGKWIHDGYDIPHGVDWMHCSACGRRDVYCPAAKTNYCPDCGAKMDGE